jgi:hypothetical protein
VFDTVLGLPVHALVVHAVVVLVPLAAVGLVAVAVRPAWRQAYAPVVALLATAGLAAVPIAVLSGRRLKERIPAQGVVADQIDRHQHWANLVIYPTAAMWLLALAVLYLDRRRVVGRGATVVSVLAVVAALAATAQVMVAGHLGSTAVWKCTIGSC